MKGVEWQPIETARGRKGPGNKGLNEGASNTLPAHLCPHFEDRAQCPEGYLQWHDWAETMGETHKQIKCGGCGLYTIWEPK